MPLSEGAIIVTYLFINEKLLMPEILASVSFTFSNDIKRFKSSIVRL